MLQNSGAEKRVLDSSSAYITAFVCAAVTGQISVFTNAAEFCSPFRFTWKKQRKNFLNLCLIKQICPNFLPQFANKRPRPKT